MNTLIITPNWIGDALMAQPLLMLLKRADPAGNITVLAPHWVAPVFDAMPEVDEVLPTTLAHGRLQLAERRKFASGLANEGYARAFVLPNSFKAALIPWLAHIPERIGYRGEARIAMINRRVDGPDANRPMAARYAQLASAVGIALPDVLPDPKLVADTAMVEATLQKFGLQAERLFALCPGAEYGPAKRWPVEHFAELATLIAARDPGAQIVLLGGPGDRMIAASIVARATLPPRDDGHRTIQNLAGQTDLDEAIALIAAATHVVSNDSGLMHVAAALARPQTALFGSSDPRHTPPLSSTAQVLWLHLDCSPCFERVCPLGHLNCLVRIEPHRVLETLQN